MKHIKNILLRGSWQTRNIGDIAHTPGFLSLAQQVIPEVRMWLWPCQIDRGVREMLLDNFPGLTIVESEAEVSQAFGCCDLLINGSGPGVDLDTMELWHTKTGKPYGFFGVSADGLWSERKREIFSNAAFIFCRDSLSVHFLNAQNLSCPLIGFAPDSSYFLNLKPGVSARTFLETNGLEKESFVCVITHHTGLLFLSMTKDFTTKTPVKKKSPLTTWKTIWKKCGKSSATSSETAL